MRGNRFPIALIPAIALAIFSCGDGPPPVSFERARIRVGKKTVTVELARSPEEKRRGLMFRRSLAPDEGMLFIYDSPRIMSFWMKNTRIPLSVAFIDSQGRITRIEKMRPFDTVGRHVSMKPCLYALEMRQGWFEANGVSVGDSVEIPKWAAAPAGHKEDG